MLKIGSHVAMSGAEMLVGSVKEALSYQANTFMFYTGAPQNTRRKPISELRIEEAKALMRENDIDIDDLVIHAPYIINLANSIKPTIIDLALTFLKQEIQRAEAIGVSMIVLHPGSHVGAGEAAGIKQIINGLNQVLDSDQKVKIALETMSGKGTEVGFQFEQLRQIIDGVNHPELLGICLDTCHIHDAGYDLTKLDEVIQQFDDVIGIDKLLMIHVNDSKNPRGARKDRHENIGYGYIGFDILNRVVHHPKFAHLPKILETPYIGDHAPYREEIEMFKTNHFKKIKDQELIVDER